eukprot:TRINITY_DN8588_c0_g1_i1.p1 TRINITY_DN8588_c0_g1~~TRINITY_DN8588_c0_g1_i1.p1  ORF type:complete len:297 (-),score=23.98 TRINITY_DN8588_c0_g1_i1:318-1208(-)
MAQLDSRGMAIDVRPYVFGGLAAMIAESCTFPMDTAKTRLQIQGNQIRYRGAVHTIFTVLREEGLASLYKGLCPALLRQAVYGTIKYGLYYSAKDVFFSLNPKKRESNLVNLCCAVFAGSVSSAVATPTDVVKVRMQARSAHSHGSLIAVFLDIARKEGKSGLFRGMMPTAQRAGMVAGVQLPVYDFCRDKLARSKLFPEGGMTNLVASVLAGLAACAASNPIDVIKTRLMVQRRYLDDRIGHQNRIYRSSMDCCITTVRTEGFFALYKGFLPAFGRMGPWNIIFFLVYEKFKSAF